MPEPASEHQPPLPFDAELRALLMPAPAAPAVWVGIEKKIREAPYADPNGAENRAPSPFSSWRLGRLELLVAAAAVVLLAATVRSALRMSVPERSAGEPGGRTDIERTPQPTGPVLAEQTLKLGFAGPAVLRVDADTPSVLLKGFAENTGGRPLWLPKSSFPGNRADLWAARLTRLSGDPIESAEVEWKGGATEFQPEDFVELKPGERMPLSVSLYLSAYSAQPGHYRVQLVYAFYGKGEAAGEAARRMRSCPVGKVESDFAELELLAH